LPFIPIITTTITTIRITMLDPFILKALLAGIGVALMAGPLGCFIAWQRMVYFGDMMAHSALLGVVLALSFELPAIIGMTAVAAAISLVLHRFSKQTQLASDSLLGIAAHGALALGLVLLSLSKTITIDVNGLLFGDVLAVSNQDVMLIFLLAAAVGGWLITSWRNLLRMAIHSDIAKVEGLDVAKQRLYLLLALALVVALSIKVVGILLVTSMLVIPAAAARALSKTPTQMVFYAIVMGVLAVISGLYASLVFDLPTGPSIILAALACFIVSRLKPVPR
jgi:zinc transport system permease protein